MAVGAILGCAEAGCRVREMRVERLTAVTFGGKSLLLRINPFAVRVLRANDNRARRTNDRHPVFLHRAVNAEHENIVAHDLWIVGRVIPIGDAFEFVLWHTLVRFHRQMTTETTRCPRRVTDLESIAELSCASLTRRSCGLAGNTP